MPRRGEASSERWALSSETGMSGTSGTSGMSGTGTEPGGTGGTWGEQRCSWSFQSLQVASTMGIIKKLCDCKLLHEKIAGDTNLKKKTWNCLVNLSGLLLSCVVMYFLCSRLGFTLKRYGRAYNFVPSVGFKVSPMRSGSRVNVGLNMLKWGCLALKFWGHFIPFYRRKHIATLCTPP